MAVAVRRQRRRRALGIVVSLAALTGIGADVAASTPRHLAPGSDERAAVHAPTWVRYPAAPFTRPAGELCGFPLRSEPVFDQVYARTTATFADGSLRRQEFSGPLVVRLTNTTTGRSTETDLSGYAAARYRPDGSYDLDIWGPAAVGFGPGDSLPRGYYRLSGHHRIRFATDGTRRILVDQGPEENLCHVLT